MKNYDAEDIVPIDSVDADALIIDDGFARPFDLREAYEIARRIRWAALEEELPGLLKAKPEQATECVVAKMVNCGASFACVDGIYPYDSVEAERPKEEYRDTVDRWAIRLPNTENAERYTQAIIDELQPDYPMVERYGGRPTIIMPPVMARLAMLYDNWPDALAFLVEDALLERRRAEREEAETGNGW